MTDNRRIVVAGNFWLGSAAEGITQGLRKLDWDICNVEMQAHFMSSPLLSLRLLSRVLKTRSIASYNRAVLDSVDVLRPRAFLTFKGSYITAETLREIRRRGVMALLYYTDFHFDHADVDQDAFVLYDHIFTNCSLQIPYLERKLGPGRASLMYFGYSPQMHFPRLTAVKEQDFVADCGYVGTCTPYKARWIDAIASNLPDVKLAIVGNGWKPSAALKSGIAGHQLVGDAYVRFLQQVRINVAFHMGPFGTQNWQDQVSMRSFEIPASKGFMLHIDNAETRALFEVGRQIDVFSTAEELCEKIRYYLDRPELRSEMIERAYARAVPDYSYDNRARPMAELLETWQPPHSE